MSQRRVPVPPRLALPCGPYVSRIHALDELTRARAGRANRHFEKALPAVLLPATVYTISYCQQLYACTSEIDTGKARTGVTPRIRACGRWSQACRMGSRAWCFHKPVFIVLVKLSSRVDSPSCGVVKSSTTNANALKTLRF